MPRYISTGFLIFLALTVWWSPEAWNRLTGFRPLSAAHNVSLDDEFPVDEREAPRFFAERDRVKIVVPREMTVREFLAVYQLRLSHVEEQLAEQMGSELPIEDEVLQEGLVLELSLTPPGDDW